MHKVKFGGQATYHKFIPNILSGKQDSVVFNPSNESLKYAVEKAFYIQDDWDITNDLKINYGIRWSGFTQVGPYARYTRDEDRNKLDSTNYSNFQQIKTYNGVEPRLTVRYSLGEQTSVKGSLSRNFQFIHLVSNSSST